MAAVAIAHALNPNVVRKRLAEQHVKPVGAATPAPAQRVPRLQLVSVELAKSEHGLANISASQPDIRIELGA